MALVYKESLAKVGLKQITAARGSLGDASLGSGFGGNFEGWGFGGGALLGSS